MGEREKTTAAKVAEISLVGILRVSLLPPYLCKPCILFCSQDFAFDGQKLFGSALKGLEGP